MRTMTFTGPTRVVLGVVLAAGAFAYLVLVDVGVSAGRIHHGVHVGGLDLGGLTEAEALPLVEELGRTVEEAPIVFSTEGFDCRFVPSELGWGPQPFDTVRRAKSVGRRGGPVAALRERFRAWMGGVGVTWAGRADPAALRRWSTKCEGLGERLGIEVDGKALRLRARRAMSSWPRDQVMELPLG